MTRRQRATAAVLVLLGIGILMVELGWRDAQAGRAVATPPPALLAPIVERLRAVPIAAIDDAEVAAIASGVTFGRTEHVSSVDERAFLESGLWHLLAASGQNIALVAGCCVLLARGVGAGRVAGSVLALAAIPFYALIVGGGASIVRAAIMGELGVVAWLLGRLPDARHLLLVVAACIVWGWPGAHRGLGMQLSFACVAALVAWAVPLTRWLTSRGVPGPIAAGTAATVLCSSATAPILVLRTGAAPLTGVLANVLAVPLAGAILVLGLAGSVLTVVVEWSIGRDLGSVLLWPTGLLAGMLQDIARRAASWPGAQTSSQLLGIGMPALLLVASGRVRRIGQRGRRVAGIVLVLLVTSEFVPGVGGGALTQRVRLGGIERPPPGALRIASLDVGQGDATLLDAGDGAAVLVDVGPPRGGVVARLRELGVTRLEGVVLTHDSLDHRGAFEEVLGALRPRWVAMPAHAPGPWQRIRQLVPGIRSLCAGDELQVGGAEVDVLHPRCDGRITPLTGDLHNDGAMVLLVRHGGIRALLPADAEGPVLLRLGLPRLDVLRVSHHGSADPALERLLTRTGPTVATISSGAGNSYGHPAPSTLETLRRQDVVTLRTDREGSIVLDSDGRTLRRRR